MGLPNKKSEYCVVANNPTSDVGNLGSNLSLVTGCHYIFHHGFPQLHLVNARIITKKIGCVTVLPIL
jgi:hypothetical protein